MKKILLLFIVIFCLTGCINRIELSDRALVQSIAIDKYNNQLKISFEIIATKLSLEDKTVSIIYSQQGDNLEIATKLMEQKIGKRMFYGQTKVIFFGNDYSKSGIIDAVKFLNEQAKIRPTVKVFIANQSGEQIIRIKPKDGELISNTADSIASNLFKTKQIKKVLLFDLVKSISQPQQTLEIPALRGVDKTQVEYTTTIKMKNLRI